MGARSAAAAGSAVLVAALLAPSVARAGRTDFGWLNDTETVPERGVELEQWISDQYGQGTPGQHETAIWWAPVIGITDQLELALPITWQWAYANSGTFSSSSTQLETWGAELRWRLASSDPVDAPALVPMVRLAISKPLYVPSSVDIDAEALLSYTTGRVHAVADVTLHDYVVEHAGDPVQLHGGAGVSVGVTDELRLGGEVYAEVGVNSATTSGEDWVTVGPDLAWTHGRFWLSASWGVGVYQVGSAGRLKWAVAF